MDRLIQPGALEVRAVQSEIRLDRAGRVEGYAAVFSSWSVDLGGFREMVVPGAFTRSLDSGADVRGLFNHDANFVLGRRLAKTLDVAEDGQGLHYRATLPDATWARDLSESIRRGDINQSSFQFVARRDEWKQEADFLARHLIDVDLLDVSIVTFPAYTSTSASVRAVAYNAPVMAWTPEPEASDHRQALMVARLRLAQSI